MDKGLSGRDACLARLQLAVDLETALAELYRRFSVLFAEDAVFWRRLSGEERRHAAMLDGLRSLEALGMMPAEALFPDAGEMADNRQAIDDQVEAWREAPPDAASAFRFALACEQSASELHYQVLLKTASANPVVKVMQDLGRADLDHLRRLRLRLRHRGIAAPGE